MSRRYPAVKVIAFSLSREMRVLKMRILLNLCEWLMRRIDRNWRRFGFSKWKRNGLWQERVRTVMYGRINHGQGKK